MKKQKRAWKSILGITLGISLVLGNGMYAAAEEGNSDAKQVVNTAENEFLTNTDDSKVRSGEGVNTGKGEEGSESGSEKKSGNEDGEGSGNSRKAENGEGSGNNQKAENGEESGNNQKAENGEETRNNQEVGNVEGSKNNQEEENGNNPEGENSNNPEEENGNEPAEEVTGYDYLTAINAYEAQNIVRANRVSGVKVGVIDSGFNLEHPMLQGRVSAESIKYLSDQPDDYVSLTQGYFDSEKTHGTGVASVLLEAAGDTIDELVLVDAGVNRGGGADSDDIGCTISSVVNAINYLKDCGVDVINMSLGSSTSRDSMEIRDAINAAYQEGIIMVCSVGNDGKQTTVYPADYAKTISVMALDESGSLWRNSNYGDTKDIAAPGVNIKTADAGENYALHSGTSLSASMVSAAAAMMRCVRPDLKPYQVLNVLKKTAGSAGSVSTLDACSAVAAALTVEPISFDDDHVEITLSESSLTSKEVSRRTYYEGVEKDIAVSFYGHLLDPKLDYTVSVKEAAEKNEDQLTVTLGFEGETGFADTDLSFEMMKKDIKDCTARAVGNLVLSDDVESIHPEVELFFEQNGIKTELRKDIDYEVTGYGKNNTSGENAGSVSVSGKGIYEGSLVIRFDIIDAGSLVAEGSCGETVSYALYGDGTLIISGEGPMADYTRDTLLFSKLTDAKGNRISVNQVVIQEGITTVGNYAFWECDDLTEVQLPDSLREIGDFSFAKCSFSEFVISENVQSLGVFAFGGCHNLKHITIPPSVTSIKRYAFIGTDIGYVSISDLEAWCKIQFETDTQASPFASQNGDNHLLLNGEEVIDLVIPESITKINGQTFCGLSNIKTVQIPEGVTEIGESAFSECTGLTSIEIPEGVTEIGAGAFYQCSGLTTIKFPESLKRIGGSAFYGCQILSNVYIPSLEAWCSIEYESLSSHPFTDFNYNEFISKNLFVNNVQIIDVVIPDSVTEIKPYAFALMNTLRSVTMPAHITEIGEYAFWNCSDVQTFHLNDGMTEIKEGTFAECHQLQNIVIPEGVKIIGKDAFSNCHNMTFITIPESVERIEEYAFFEGYGLSSIRIPKNTVYVSDRAFDRCGHLTSIVVDDENPVYDSRNNCNAIIEKGTGLLIRGCCNTTFPDTVTKIGEAAFSACDMEEIEIPDTITEIGAWAFFVCGNLKRIVLPVELTCITLQCFCGCEKLESIEIPASVTVIEPFAFDGCTSLNNVDFPVGLKMIGEGAFSGCALTSVTLPETLELSESALKAAFDEGVIINRFGLPAETQYGTCGSNAEWSLDPEGNLVIWGNGKIDPYIGGISVWWKWYPLIRTVTIRDRSTENDQGITGIAKNAFNGFKSLESVYLPETIQSIGDYAFAYCSKLPEINIPQNVREIGKYAFYDDRSLWNVEIPGNSPLQRIQTNTFAYCTSLRTIGLENALELTEIESYAFNNCQSLQEISLPSGVREIGELAFFKCRSMNNFTIPSDSNLDLIGDAAFAYCSGLEEICLPKNFRTLEEQVFVGCSSLKKADFRASALTQIPDYAFYECTELREVLWPENLRSIGSYAFYECDSLEDAAFPSTLSGIDAFSFACCDQLRTVVFANPDTTIGAYAFYACPRLSTVTLPENLSAIEEGTFARCTGLTAFSIPDSVTQIGDNAFHGDTDLRVEADFDNWRLVGRYAFYGVTSLKEGAALQNASVGEKAFGTGQENMSILDDALFRLTAIVGNIGLSETQYDEAEDYLAAVSTVENISVYCREVLQNTADLLTECLELEEDVSTLVRVYAQIRKNLEIIKNEIEFQKNELKKEVEEIKADQEAADDLLKNMVRLEKAGKQISEVQKILDQKLQNGSGAADALRQLEMTEKSGGLRANSLIRTVGDSYTLEKTEGEDGYAFSASDEIVSVMSRTAGENYVLFCKAPGTTEVIYASPSYVGLWKLVVKTPIKVDPNGHYKEASYVTNDITMYSSDACSHPYDKRVSETITVDGVQYRVTYCAVCEKEFDRKQTSGGQDPTPDPVTPTPSPDPVTSTPTPSPDPVTPTPTPSPATPTPTPGPATPTPTPGPATPTPTPATPTPTPSPVTPTPTPTKAPVTPAPSQTPITPAPTNTSGGSSQMISGTGTSSGRSSTMTPVSTTGRSSETATAGSAGSTDSAARDQVKPETKEKTTETKPGKAAAEEASVEEESLEEDLEEMRVYKTTETADAVPEETEEAAEGGLKPADTIIAGSVSDAAAEEKPAEGLPVWAIVLICAGGAAALIVIVLLKKRQNPS